MQQLLSTISHIAVTLVALGTLALRLEHRLTKIETDIGWLKDRNGCGDDEEK